MIDVTKVTDFERSEKELQEFILLCVCVAGKTATMQASRLEAFLTPSGKNPFDIIRRLGRKRVIQRLKKVKMGQYTRISNVFMNLASKNLDLSSCSVEELESIKGIGPKTSRFFILHSRPNQRMACLDTHILAWLREKGIKTPKTTPPQPRYGQIEKEFLKLAAKEKMDPATLDLKIWNERYRRVKSSA